MQENGRRGVVDLVRDLGGESRTLVKQEVRLARLEVKEKIGEARLAAAFAAGGAVLALVGALAATTGLVLLVGDEWLRDRMWLAGIVVALLALGVAAWQARRGMTHLSPRELLPDQTVETLKEDREWLKRRLKSDGTSK